MHLPTDWTAGAPLAGSPEDKLEAETRLCRYRVTLTTVQGCPLKLLPGEVGVVLAGTPLGSQVACPTTS